LDTKEIEIVKCSKLVLVFAMLIASNAVGQGTFLFRWHGQSNFFQASFEITEDDTLPGTRFRSPLFTNTVQITSLDGLTYRASDVPNPFVGGSFSPLNLTFILADQNTLSRIEANVVPGQGASIVETSPLPNGNHGETGFWSYEIIPEPSMCSLLACSLGTWFARKRNA
jgi:hypothetical protein